MSLNNQLKKGGRMKTWKKILICLSVIWFVSWLVEGNKNRKLVKIASDRSAKIAKMKKETILTYTPKEAVVLFYIFGKNSKEVIEIGKKYPDHVSLEKLNRPDAISFAANTILKRKLGIKNTDNTIKYSPLHTNAMKELYPLPAVLKLVRKKLKENPNDLLNIGGIMFTYLMDETNKLTEKRTTRTAIEIEHEELDNKRKTFLKLLTEHKNRT